MPIKPIGPSVIIQLRRRYREAWGRDWPYDNEYLAELWREERFSTTWDHAPRKLERTYEATLMRMRENHEFEPA